ncbi:Uncharacterised protein [Klebsiella michiganensis]|uniref:Uncharacterized protein n=1 Tax=Klebsiella michiganensis TaxID=1134687 RepID=A0A7H4N503_9ENTR|nr:Uncharacterised protein [Klebsiella michiganensis]
MLFDQREAEGGARGRAPAPPRRRRGRRRVNPASSSRSCGRREARSDSAFRRLRPHSWLLRRMLYSVVVMSTRNELRRTGAAAGRAGKRPLRQRASDARTKIIVRPRDGRRQAAFAAVVQQQGHAYRRMLGDKSVKKIIIGKTARVRGRQSAKRVQSARRRRSARYAGG